MYLTIVKLTAHSNLYVDSKLVSTKTQNLKESLQNIIILLKSQLTTIDKEQKDIITVSGLKYKRVFE